MSKLLTGYLILATAGATIDGRVIEEKWLEDIAANYNQETYSAVINYEHYRYFGNLGLVHDVRLSKNNDGKTTLEGRLNPNHYLVQLNKDGQKLFTSIEVEPNFAATGSAYLVGLAVTDSPASLGTSQLEFSKHGSSTVFSNPIEFNVSIPGTESDEDKLFSKMAKFFSRHTLETTNQTDHSQDDSMDKAQFDNFQESLKEHFSDQVTSLTSAINEGFAAMNTQETPEAIHNPTLSQSQMPKHNHSFTTPTEPTKEYSDLKKDHDTLKTEFADLKATLDKLSENVPGTDFSSNEGDATAEPFI